jgi:hypothetical protein
VVFAGEYLLTVISILTHITLSAQPVLDGEMRTLFHTYTKINVNMRTPDTFAKFYGRYFQDWIQLISSSNVTSMQACLQSLEQLPFSFHSLW